MPVPRLDVLIPEHGFADPDAMLGAFLTWTEAQGLTLYGHQEEALLELFAGKHVVLDAPTGSGKSLVAAALHFSSFARAKRSWYTAPIKALVSEKFFALCEVFGPESVGMITGDGAVNRDAPIICCTTEILANLALREGAAAEVDSAVLDEFHYYADRDRGWAWQLPLLRLPQATFLLMSATLGDTRGIRDDLERRTGRPVAEIRGAFRPVPLSWAWSTQPIHQAIAELVRKDKAPIYVVHFTQAEATAQAQALTSVELCSKERKRALIHAVRGFRFHSPFGPTFRRYVLHGVGLHHAGLLPRYRRLVERLAQQGLLEVICGTDTLGVGINVPIRTVLFTQLCKFDGERTRLLEAREFHQIAGRAGRAGFDTEGHVVVQAPAHVIENERIAALADEKKRKKTARAQPPTKGYQHWDEPIFRRIVQARPEPLRSRFSVDHGRLLTLMQRAEATTWDARAGVDALHALVDDSHASAAERARLHTATDALLDDLLTGGVARDVEGLLVLDSDLQRDFSLHHSLSLYLLAVLQTLDPTTESFPLEVLTRIEAILPHPTPVLRRQVDQAKTALINELKAAGVPYEERIAVLEEVTWPKPSAEAIYQHFNTYAKAHPWVAKEAIRPKSVARAMAELQCSFAEYVKELGLERSEGVLLRYLSEVYRALRENVPQPLQTDELVEVAAYLRAELALVDASLLAEWEHLVSGEGEQAADPERPADASADKRAFMARVRAELHAVVRALARQDFEEASGCLRRRDEDDPWTAEALEQALAPFFEEYGGLGFDHRARQAWNTTLQPEGPHRWTVRQRLFPPVVIDPLAPPEDEEALGDWALVGRIDLRDDTNPDGPLVELVAIGEE
ncbi:MAG: DUF3516 domain-containing protein [Pseudomonadota bacterium]